MHPVNNLWTVFLVHTQHFAQGKKRHFFGEHFYKVDLGSLALHLVQKTIDLGDDFLAQRFDIGGYEEVFLLDPHFHVLRRIHIDQ